MNTYEQRSKATYDQKAKDYDNTFDGKLTVKFKQLLFQNVTIQSGDAIADIACGNGRFLHMLAEHNTFHGYGVDISEEMIHQAQLLNPNMQFSVGTCDQLPFDNNSMDTMTVSAAFHHFPNVIAFAQEAQRVIKQNGLLYIAEINLPTIFRTILNPFLRFSPSGDVHFYSPTEISALFEQYGFVSEKVIVDGSIQLIVLRKI